MQVKNSLKFTMCEYCTIRTSFQCWKVFSPISQYPFKCSNVQFLTFCQRTIKSVQKSARTVLEEKRLFCVGLLMVMIKLIIMKLLLMFLFREELGEVADLLGEEKRDGTCRVITLGGRTHHDNDDHHNHDNDHHNHDNDHHNHDNDDHHNHDNDHHNHDRNNDDVSDEVIKETLKSKLSNLQLSNTAVEFLTN